jgi:hypothetical protein
MSERFNPSHDERPVAEREQLALEIVGKVIELLEKDGFEWQTSGRGKNLHAEYSLDTPELIAEIEPAQFNKYFNGGVARLVIEYSFPYVEQTQEGFLFKTGGEIEHPGVTKAILRVPRTSGAYDKEELSLIFEGNKKPVFYYSNEIRSAYSRYQLPYSYPIRIDQREATEKDLKDFLGLLNSPMFLVEPADYLNYSLPPRPPSLV